MSKSSKHRIRCGCCSRKLAPKYGRLMRDGDNKVVWVCYECMPKNENKLGT